MSVLSGSGREDGCPGIAAIEIGEQAGGQRPAVIE